MSFVPALAALALATAALAPAGASTQEPRTFSSAHDVERRLNRGSNARIVEQMKAAGLQYNEIDKVRKQP